MDQQGQPKGPEQNPHPVVPEGASSGSAEKPLEGGAEELKMPEKTSELGGESQSAASAQPDPQTNTAKDDNDDNVLATEVEDVSLVPSDLEEKKLTDLDKTFVKAAKKIIDDYEGKPYEEEEAHQGLQIKYLWQRFKRKIGKGE